MHRRFCLCPPRVYFPVLYKFWQFCGGVNGNLLQEDLCHTHTQSPCPCSRPLPTHNSTEDAQTQFCLSLCGVPGSWCAQGMFEPSKHLCREWKVKVKLLNCVRLFATPWTAASLAPPSMGFSREEYWSGLPFPSPGDLPDSGIGPGSPSLQADTTL